MMNSIMNKCLALFFFLSFYSNQLSSQNIFPTGFNYQGIIRDQTGSPIIEKNVTLVIQIVKSNNSQIVFEEKYDLKTNKFGLIEVVVGTGTKISGEFNSIDWKISSFSLKTIVTYKDGNANKEISGSAIFSSVPYAFLAREVINEKDADPTNELQSLQISNDTLSISKGNKVRLPLYRDTAFWKESNGQIYSLKPISVGINKQIQGVSMLVKENLEISDKNGNSALSLIGDDTKGGRFSLYNTKKVQSIFLGSKNDLSSGNISIFDQNGKFKIDMCSNGDLAGFLEVYGQNERTNVLLSSLDKYPNSGYIGIADYNGKNGISMYVSGLSSYGVINTSGDNGNITSEISIGETNNLGRILVANENGTSRASLSALKSGAGLFESQGKSGGTIARMSSYNDQNPDNGYIGVFNKAEQIKASIYVDEKGRGIVQGDTLVGKLKNFRIDDPLHPDKEIWYASIEGPEAAAYLRGTAELKNGKVLIAFPEHFQSLVTVPGMTIQLTPRSAQSKGLAVTDRTSKGFTVQELWDGKGNYSFDWEVKAIRKGYENYEVVRDKKPNPTGSKSSLDFNQVIVPAQPASSNHENNKQ